MRPSCLPFGRLAGASPEPARNRPLRKLVVSLGCPKHGLHALAVDVRQLEPAFGEFAVVVVERGLGEPLVGFREFAVQVGLLPCVLRGTPEVAAMEDHEPGEQAEEHRGVDRVGDPFQHDRSLWHVDVGWRYRWPAGWCNERVCDARGFGPEVTVDMGELLYRQWGKQGIVEVGPDERLQGHPLKHPNVSVGWDGVGRTNTCWTCYHAGARPHTMRYVAGGGR